MKLNLINNKNYLFVVDVDNNSLPFQPINNYLIHRSNLARATKVGLSRALIIFFSWLNGKNLDFKCVTFSDIIEFRDTFMAQPDARTIEGKLFNKGLEFVHVKGKGVDTINEEISHIRNFYQYLVVNKEISVHPFPTTMNSGKKINIGYLAHTKTRLIKLNNLKMKKDCFSLSCNEEKAANKPFNKSEIQKIFTIIKNPQEVLLLCMLLLGMRISEASGRRINDISWSQMKINIILRPGDEISDPIKYNSQREIPIKGILYFDNLPEVMHSAYKQYVDMILKPKKDMNKENYLFITTQGKVKKLSKEGLREKIIYRKIQKEITDRKITFHTFRHHYATTEIAMGTPIEKVQNYLGHKHISTTIGTYYNPTLELMDDLYKNKLINNEEVKERIEYLEDYKKRFSQFMR